MDSPFFRSHWNQPSRPRNLPTFRGIPVQRMPTTSSSSPKVVSIPVHFVGSETLRSASALKIQKVFRGFLVRKSVKRIASIRSEVDEIERRISRSETVELIRREPKERLRVNEALMALLFKLDSVRGVDSGVRDCRKAVIKKAIALQEKVDDIVTSAAAADQTLGTEASDQAVEVDDSDSLAEAVDQTLEIEGSAECLVESENVADQTQGKELGIKDSANVPIESSVDSINASDQTLETEVKAPKAEDPVDQLEDANCSENAVDETLEFDGPDKSVPNSVEFEAKEEGVETPAALCEKMDITEVGVDFEVKTTEEPCVVKDIVENCNAFLPASERVEESVEMRPTENWREYSVNAQSLFEGGEGNNSEKLGDAMEVHRPDRTVGDKKDCSGVGGIDDKKGSSRELLERMMDDNEKMMSLMTRLFERNEMQTRMLNSIMQRVEHLEKAFMCDRLRRKKKKNTA